jgi:hypothetical protein
MGAQYGQTAKSATAVGAVCDTAHKAEDSV